MTPLSIQDQRHLKAAEGWCGLNSFLEANEELENITPQARAHPEVLDVRWQIYANLAKWDGALDIANALVKLRPDWSNGYIYRATSLRKLNRHMEALETLNGAVSRFPSNKYILYDLACINCTLKRIDDARLWLGKAIDVGGKEIKLKALDDPYLEPIWKCSID